MYMYISIMYMCIQVCTCVYRYVHVYTGMYMCIHVCTCVYRYAHVYTFMYICIQVCTCVYRYVHVYTGMYMCIQVCTCVYRYVHVYTGMYSGMGRVPISQHFLAPTALPTFSSSLLSLTRGGGRRCSCFG